MSLARERGMTAGGSVLFLTVLGTLSQLLGFGYRVALSRMVGAEVMGLYQLIMPVYSVLLSLTAVGLTAAVSNLTPQYLALGNSRGIPQLLGTCLKILFLLMVPISAVVLLCYDPISVYWLGDARTQLGLILLLPCVALTGVENLHKHFFYGSSLVRPPAVAELLEQLVRTGAVLGLLAYFLPQYPERVVGLIVAGMVICEVASAVTLTVLCRWRLRRMGLKGPGEPGRVRRRRVFSIALPVGLNALLGNLMGGGERRPGAPEAGGGGHGALPGHLRAGGGVRHDPAHAGPAHRLFKRHESGAGPPAGPVHRPEPPPGGAGHRLQGPVRRICAGPPRHGDDGGAGGGTGGAPVPPGGGGGVPPPPGGGHRPELLSGHSGGPPSTG